VPPISAAYIERLGKYLALLQCEELVGGRWEPFCSEIGRDGVYYRASDRIETLLSLRSQPHGPN
jgi:hypothetical protein